MTADGDDVVISVGSERRTVHLPTILPVSGTYTIRTGQPINIEPGFQEVVIAISLAPKPDADRREKPQP